MLPPPSSRARHGEKTTRYMAKGTSMKRILPVPLARPRTKLGRSSRATEVESSVNMAVVLGMAKTEYGSMYHMRA